MSERKPTPEISKELADVLVKMVLPLIEQCVRKKAQQWAEEILDAVSDNIRREREEQEKQR